MLFLSLMTEPWLCSEKVPKTLKYLWIKFNQGCKRPECWKTMRKKLKTQTNGNRYHVLGFEEAILSKCSYSNQCTHSLQSLSEVHQHFSQKNNKLS